MALIAHWPLNGNTNDISGNWLNGTPVNITYENGKIGQAAIFNGTTSYVTIANQMNLLGSWSFCVWLKLSASTKTYQFLAGNSVNSGTTGKIMARYSGKIAYSCPATNYIGFTLNTDDIVGSWNHLSFIANGSGISLYLNGIYNSRITYTNPSLNVTTIGNAWSDTAWLTGGQINDVRIYDHVLTDMEIQEIARAKILHYTFDDMQEPTTNEADTDVKRTMVNHSSSTGTAMTFASAPEKGPGWKKMTITGRSTSNFRLAQFPYINHPINTTKTYSIEVDMGITSGYYWRIDGSTMGTSIGTIVDGKIVMTRSTTTNSQSLAIFLNHDTLGATGLNDIIYYRYYQVEVKPYATEFTEGTRIARVNDYSGFFNHSDPLTETNTPRWIPEAKIGTGAYEFSNKIIIGPGPFHISSDRLTLCAWVKPTGIHSNDRGIVIQQNGNYYLTVTPTQQVSVYWYDTSNPGYHTTTETLTLNQWSHIASVWNGTHNLIYINGLLVKTTATNTPGRIIGGSPLTIGRETTNRQFIGYIDDVRQYATALSDKDIKDLYEARAEIEQSGVLYAKDFLSNAEETVNLFINPTFESNIAGISGGMEFTVSHSSERSFDGSFSVKNVRSSISGNGRALTVSTSGIGYLANTTYTASCMVYVDPAHTATEVSISEHSGRTTTVSTSIYDMTKKGTWQRIHRTFTINSSGNLPILVVQSRLGTLTIGDTFFVDNFQIERKLYPSPFVSTYRPASQLPSTIQFGANEIHETGTANFEDYSTVGITDGLVVLLNGNDTNSYSSTDNIWRDLSGNNNHAILNGNANNPKWIGDGFYFPATANGINGAMRIENSSSLSALSIMTVELIFTLETKTVISGDSDWMCIFSKGTTGSGDQAPAISINQGTSGMRYLHIERPSGFNSTANIFTDYSGNTWYHVIAILGSTSFGYLNSQQVSTASGGITANSHPIYIGTDFDNEMFKGKLKLVKIFNRALTAEEIAIEYNTMFNNQIQIHESGTLYAKDIVQY